MHVCASLYMRVYVCVNACQNIHSGLFFLDRMYMYIQTHTMEKKTLLNN